MQQPGNQRLDGVQGNLAMSICRSIYYDNVTISSLDAYTKYDFKVVLFREGGETGMGPPGPEATIETQCGSKLILWKITLMIVENLSFFLRFCDIFIYFSNSLLVFCFKILNRRTVYFYCDCYNTQIVLAGK